MKKRAMKSADDSKEEERVHTNMAAAPDVAEGDDCKRRRQRNTILLLATSSEEIRGMRIRLFKWDESFFPDKYSDQGILMIRVSKTIKKTICPSPDYYALQEHKMLVNLFSLVNLSPRGNAMKTDTLKMFEDSNIIMDQTQINNLAEDISEYLSIHFRFTETTLACPSGRRFVVFVEVDLRTTNMYIQFENVGIINDQYEQWSDQLVLADDSMEANVKEVRLRGDVHDEADPVELKNIEASIMKYLETLGPEFIGRDKEFFRDSKGLHQVQSGIMIIVGLKEISEEVDSCPCCLDKLIVEGLLVPKTPCLHLFHRRCLYEWLSTNDSCPLC